MTLQPFVEIAACRKTYFPQIVLLQDKEKPYLGFQKLGCHCKNLRCHFDTQKRPCSYTRTPRYLTPRSGAYLDSLGNFRFRDKSGFKHICRARVGFGLVNLGSGFTMRPVYNSASAYSRAGPVVKHKMTDVLYLSSDSSPSQRFSSGAMNLASLNSSRTWEGSLPPHVISLRKFNILLI